MWEVVYITSNSEIANKIKEELENVGILAKVKSISQEGKEGYFEIIVPETDVNEAHNIIIEKGF